jgi:hypothetical protein
VRSENDFYATPDWCVRAILPHLPFAGSVLEPMAGDGAIVRTLVCAGHPCVDMIEIDPTRAAALRGMGDDIHVGDALAPEANWLWECPHGLVITNPSFRLAHELVARAVSAQRPHGGTTAMLLRLGFLAGQKRAAWHRANPCDVYVLPKRPSFTGRGTDATDYGWFCWGPGRGGRWQVLEVGE